MDKEYSDNMAKLNMKASRKMSSVGDKSSAIFQVILVVGACFSVRALQVFMLWGDRIARKGGGGEGGYFYCLGGAFFTLESHLPC